MRCIEVKTAREIKRFLDLPSRLYKNAKLNPQDKYTELKILKGTHTLSNTFEATGFIVEDEDRVVTRAVLTIYKAEKVAYIGFFESENNINAVECLIDAVRKKAIQLEIESIIGPVDCSFWIRYRFKVNHFDKTYTGEPYNLPYYEALFKGVGFKVYEGYYSLGLRVPVESDINPKFIKRLNNIKSNNIEIRHTSKKKFDEDFVNIFELLSRLYSRFPVYHTIPKESFIKMFWYFKYILDYKMVFTAYKGNELKGFMVCIPDYKSNNIIKIKTGRCKNYIMMYLGVDKSAYGLGGSFAEICRRELQNRNSRCIMALIHNGNTSGVLYKELSEVKYEYRLYKLDISL